MTACLLWEKPLFGIHSVSGYCRHKYFNHRWGRWIGCVQQKALKDVCSNLLGYGLGYSPGYFDALSLKSAQTIVKIPLPSDKLMKPIQTKQCPSFQCTATKSPQERHLSRSGSKSLFSVGFISELMRVMSVDLPQPFLPQILSGRDTPNMKLGKGGAVFKQKWKILYKSWLLEVPWFESAGRTHFS